MRVPEFPTYTNRFQLDSLVNCLQNTNLQGLGGGLVDFREFLAELELSESDVVQEKLVRFHF